MIRAGHPPQSRILSLLRTGVRHPRDVRERRCRRGASTTRDHHSSSCRMPAMSAFSNCRRRSFRSRVGADEWVEIDAMPGMDELAADLAGVGIVELRGVRIRVDRQYPPIQGGVSMRTYWTASRSRLRAATRFMSSLMPGKCVRRFACHMRPQDWQRCEAQFEAGSCGSPLERTPSTGRKPISRWPVPLSDETRRHRRTRFHAERPPSM